MSTEALKSAQGPLLGCHFTLGRCFSGLLLEGSGGNPSPRGKNDKSHLPVASRIFQVVNEMSVAAGGPVSSLLSLLPRIWTTHIHHLENPMKETEKKDTATNMAKKQ